jgi:hypothetical protein
MKEKEQEAQEVELKLDGNQVNRPAAVIKWIKEKLPLRFRENLRFNLEWRPLWGDNFTENIKNLGFVIGEELVLKNNNNNNNRNTEIVVARYRWDYDVKKQAHVNIEILSDDFSINPVQFYDGHKNNLWNTNKGVFSNLEFFSFTLSKKLPNDSIIERWMQNTKNNKEKCPQFIKDKMLRELQCYRAIDQMDKYNKFPFLQVWKETEIAPNFNIENILGPSKQIITIKNN